MSLRHAGLLQIYPRLRRQDPFGMLTLVREVIGAHDFIRKYETSMTGGRSRLLSTVVKSNALPQRAN